MAYGRVSETLQHQGPCLGALRRDLVEAARWPIQPAAPLGVVSNVLSSTVGSSHRTRVPIAQVPMAGRPGAPHAPVRQQPTTVAAGLPSAALVLPRTSASPVNPQIPSCLRG